MLLTTKLLAYAEHEGAQASDILGACLAILGAIFKLLEPKEKDKMREELTRFINELT